VTALSAKAGSGVGGTTVAITGGGLLNASKVTFGGTDAAFTKSTNHGVTTISATSPAHLAGTVDVAVTNPAGASAPSTATKFTYAPPPPAVTGLSKTSGSAVGGETVTITGEYLTGAKAVRFGTVPQKFKVVSPTSIAVTTVRGVAGTGNVTVVGPGGTSAVVDGVQFTFVAPPAPAVTGLSASTGYTFGGTPVTVTGTDFTYATKVLVGAKSVPFKRLSATTLGFVTPVAAAGAVDVRVGDPWATSDVADAAKFTYQTPPVPAITELSRTSGPTYLPSVVTITGTGFIRVSKVLVEGKPVKFKHVSETTIGATVPARPAGAVTVQVVTPGGTSPAVDVAKFTHVAPPEPTVTALSKTEALTYVSTPVTITGTDFVAVSKVFVGDKAVAFKHVNGTTITATFPPATAGAKDVKVVTPGGTSAAVTFTYNAPPEPVVTELSATSGLTYVSTPVTITGTGLTAASKVLVGGVAAKFSKVDDTTVKATLMPHAAGEVDVQVVTPGGTSAAVKFTYNAPPTPVVTTLSPNKGYTIANTPVTITGTDLTAASKVFVGTKSVTFKRVSATSITFTAPAAPAGEVQVTVVTPGGTSEGVAFTYEAPPAPTLVSLDSASGAVGAARWVVATGTTLSSVSQALVGTTAVTYQRVSDTSIKIQLPARTEAGTVDITVVGPGGTSPGAVQYEYTAA
jgi:hypothetical protein